MAPPSLIQLLSVAPLFILLPISAADPPPVAASSICNSTLYPAYCRSVLQSDGNRTATVHQYGYFSLNRAIRQATRFAKLVDMYLSSDDGGSLDPATINALEDCRHLALVNGDYLNDTFDKLRAANKTLSDAKADDVQTLLSAILTNQQTCVEGLESSAATWSLMNGLSPSLSNNTKLYSVSLSLVTTGWVPKTKKRKFRRGRTRSAFHSDDPPMEAPPPAARKLLELGRRRQLGDGDVLIRDLLTVCQDGSCNFTTIMGAMAAAPINANATAGYFLIYVKAGVYDENVTVEKSKKYILVIGDGINQTIITGNRSVVDGWTTFNSATLIVSGKNFVGVDLTVRNTAGAIKGQAVALRCNADFAAFYSCSFEGYQDTLYTHSFRQFYRECDIYGTVDFIFGNAAVVLQNCNIYPRRPLFRQFNAITAQGRTDPNQNTGTAIQNCTVRPADDLAAGNVTVRTYLGRPWKEYSRTVYLQSYHEAFIQPAGWREWNGTFALATLCYGEFNNTGLGSNTTNRVTWPGYHVMNGSDASNFTVSSFLLAGGFDDWLQTTGVPYFTGFA